MPRKPRMFQANMPCHVISRGNNRNACFFAHEDYLFYCNYSAHEPHYAIQACTRHLRGLLIEDLVFKRIDPRSDTSRMTQ